MKVLALGADKSGCFKYRIFEPARVTKDLGLDIEVSHGLDVEAEQNVKTSITTVKEIHTDADVIIFQRPIDNSFVSAIKQAKRQGIATVVEIDDDLDSVHKNNAAYSALHGKKSYGASWTSLACQEADLVTVSTPALEKYASHGRSKVLRNCVPKSIFSLQKEITKSFSRLGWTGSLQTHPNDLQETKGSIRDVLNSNHKDFYVVGDGLDVSRVLKLDRSSSVIETGWVDLENYYQKLLDTIDIGIVPLELSPFNEAKSYLKGLEMAALGIPFVASPTYEYKLLEVYGVGKTAKSPGDWRKHLNNWMNNESKKESDGRTYQSIIEDNYTYENNAHLWIDAWEYALDYRKKNK